MVDRDSIKVLDSSFSAILRNMAPPHPSKNIAHDELVMTIEALEKGMFRLRIRELDEHATAPNPLHHTWNVNTVSRRRPAADVLLDSHVKAQKLATRLDTHSIRLRLDSRKFLNLRHTLLSLDTN